MRPSPIDHGSFYQGYIDNTAIYNEPIDAIKASYNELEKLLISISTEKGDYAYASGKWTLKELLQHMIDAERIFTYRALCVARGEQQPLLSFDENEYAANSNANARNWKDLVDEMLTLRQNTIQLYNSFNEDQLNRRGIMSNTPITVNALGFIIAGHAMHHVKIVKERYL